MLSSTFHAHAVLKHAPVLAQKSQGMQVVRTFCSSTVKARTVTHIFYFTILIQQCYFLIRKKLAIFWQFHDQRRRKLYHTLSGNKGRETL